MLFTVAVQALREPAHQEAAVRDHRAATKIASGIKAVPRKLAYGIKAIADLDEDKSKIVGDVAKPKPKEDSA